MDFAFINSPVQQLVLMLFAGLVLVLLLAWVFYRAIKAAVRDGILDARQIQSRDTWLPTERQTLDGGRH